MQLYSHYVTIVTVMRMGIMHFDKGTRNIMESSTVGFLRAITIVINTENFQKKKPIIVLKCLLEYTVHLSKTACESRTALHLYF